MATGDQSDITARLTRLLPLRWFSTGATILPAVLQMGAALLSTIYDQITWWRTQMRVSTASGIWLDMFAWDYFSGALARRSGEADASFAGRIKMELLRSRVTRAAMIKRITDLTGNAPTIIEPYNPTDTGSYGGPYGGYGVAGAYSGAGLAGQCFVTVHRASGQTTTANPKVAGYRTVAGGYGVGRIEYTAAGSATGQVGDAEIYQAIAATKAAGVIVWVNIDSATSGASGTFVLDQSTVGGTDVLG